MPGGTYREAVVGQPRSLNPLIDPLDPITQDVSRLIHAGLVRIADGGQVSGDLAATWSTSPDGLTYTFQLRPNMSWHDGQPISTADVQATVALLQSPNYSGPPELAALWRSVRVETPDPRTVRFTLAHPSPSFIEACSMAILPAHIFGADGAADLREHPASYRPVGAGPYRLESVTAESIVLTRFERYFGPAPYLERVELRSYPDAKEALRALARGDVDGFAGAQPSDLAGWDLGAHHVVREAPLQVQQLILYLNNERGPLVDPRVRRSIALAIDRRALVAGPMRASAIPAYGPVPAFSWAYTATVETPPDESEARRLLDEAGWTGAPLRSRNGQPLRLQLLEETDDRQIVVAEWLKGQLEVIGFRIEVQPVEPIDLLRERIFPRSYDLALLNVWLGSVDPDPYPFWHSSQREHGFNFAGYRSRAADEALTKARTDSDPTQRIAALTAFQVQWVEDTPSVVLASPMLTYVMPSALRGVRLGITPVPSARFQHLGEWHLFTTRGPAFLPPLRGAG